MAKRTNRQNNGLHQWFTDIAIALDDAGYDMREVKVRIKPTAEGVKENFYSPSHGCVVA
jgi:hypothetical protein